MDVHSYVGADISHSPLLSFVTIDGFSVRVRKNTSRICVSFIPYLVF